MKKIKGQTLIKSSTPVLKLIQKSDPPPDEGSTVLAVLSVKAKPWETTSTRPSEQTRYTHVPQIRLPITVVYGDHKLLVE